MVKPNFYILRFRYIMVYFFFQTEPLRVSEGIVKPLVSVAISGSRR